MLFELFLPEQSFPCEADPDDIAGIYIGQASEAIF